MPRKPAKTFARKMAESVLVVAAGLGLMALATFGSFTDPTTPFPPASSIGSH